MPLQFLEDFTNLVAFSIASSQFSEIELLQICRIVFISVETGLFWCHGYILNAICHDFFAYIELGALDSNLFVLV